MNGQWACPPIVGAERKHESRSLNDVHCNRSRLLISSGTKALNINIESVRSSAFSGVRLEMIKAWRERRGGASDTTPWFMANIELPDMAYIIHPENKRICFLPGDEQQSDDAAKDRLDVLCALRSVSVSLSMT